LRGVPELPGNFLLTPRNDAPLDTASRQSAATNKKSDISGALLESHKYRYVAFRRRENSISLDESDRTAKNPHQTKNKQQTNTKQTVPVSTMLHESLSI
jgi:hypothetical protein